MSGPPDEQQPPSWQQPQEQPQWQQQQPQFGEQQPQQWQGPAGGSGGTSGLAIASLILGIIGLPGGCFGIFGLLVSVPALITGIMARNRINASGGRVGGAGLALAGIILGGLGIAWAVGLTILVLAADFDTVGS